MINMPTFRNTCPRSCYGSCSMISHVNGKKLTKVQGDPYNSFTQGKLCATGYSLVQYAHDDHRLKYPMRQIQRGSGDWKRISWEQAYDFIAEAIINLNDRFGSNLGIGYFKGSGNSGLLHHAVEGMFAGLGPHTRSTGNICSGTGDSALKDILTEVGSPDPEDMGNAHLIVLWGANPAVTNINQMKFIYQSRQNGTPLVVIDPIFSLTAERADLYIQINPGTDAWLAWGVAKYLLDHHQINRNFVQQNTIGWEHYEKGLQQVCLDEVSKRTGVSLTAIKQLADYYAKYSPTATWIGFGLQRNCYGDQSIKAISALTALVEDFGIKGGGLYFKNDHCKDFPNALAKHQGVTHPFIPASREIPANDFARSALQLQDPPLKMLWISCGNPLTQNHNLRVWNSLFEQLELIITVDVYLTRTVMQSDIVLPSTSFFEEEDIHQSFWHNWISINQRVLPSFYEAKSDLQIARDLTKKLNEVCPGYSNFPADLNPEDWIRRELSPGVQELYGLNSALDLKDRPYKRKKETPSPSWKYRFFPPDPRVFSPVELADPPYHLLTPQSLLKFHTQYMTLTWLNPDKGPSIEVAKDIASRHNIQEGSLVEIFNEEGSLRCRVIVNPYLPKNTILAQQSEQYPVNTLIKGSVDNTASIPYYDCMVNIRKVPNDV